MSAVLNSDSNNHNYDEYMAMIIVMLVKMNGIKGMMKMIVLNITEMNDLLNFIRRKKRSLTCIHVIISTQIPIS